MLITFLSGVRVGKIVGFLRIAAVAGVVIALTVAPESVRAQSDDIPAILKRMSLQELMDLDVTTVSKQAEPFRQAAAAIQVLTQEDIRRSGAMNIAEALRLASNLTVAQKHSHAWAISARGFNTDLANKLLVLVDGRTVYTPLFSGVFWDRVDYLLEDIDRIEVISGPGGTLWGANAVNGVINIITKSAKNSQGWYFQGGGGTPLQDFAGGRFGGMIGQKTAFRVYGKYFDRDHEVLANGSPAPDSWRKSQGGFRIDTDASMSNAFTLQGDFYDGGENRSTGGRAKLRGGNVLGRWTRTFSEESDLQLQLYYDRTFLADPTPAQFAGGTLLSPAGTLRETLDTYDVDFQHRFRLNGRNRIVWGLGYRFTDDAVDSAPGLAFLPEKLERNLFSAFIQNELAITKNLTFTLGTKVEHNDYTGLEYEPSARLQWEVTAKQMFWGAVSRAVRMPSRVDRHESLPTPGFAPIVSNLLVGNNTFESENVIAYELGYRAQLGTKVSGSISTFYNDYDSLRSTSTSPPQPPFNLPFPFFFANDLTAKTHGVEVTAVYQPVSWWTLHSGYSFIREHIEIRPGGMDFNNRLNETADPPNQFTLRSSMSFLRNFEFDAAYRWIDGFQYSNSGVAATVRSYMEADARLAWYPLEKLELSLVGRNLFHSHHAEYVISSPNPRQEIRRGVYGKIAIRM